MISALAHAAGLDLGGAEAERGHEAGAGRADVAGGGAAGAQLAGDERRRVGQQLVLGEGRDEHELDVGAVDARGVERLRPASAASAVSEPPSARAGARGCPVRSTIHSGETPMRSAISSLGTRCGGSAAATEAMPATPASRRTGAWRPGSISAVAMRTLVPARVSRDQIPVTGTPDRAFPHAESDERGDERAHGRRGVGGALERGDAGAAHDRVIGAGGEDLAHVGAGLDAEAGGDRDVGERRAAWRSRAPARAGRAGPTRARRS